MLTDHKLFSISTGLNLSQHILVLGQLIFGKLAANSKKNPIIYYNASFESFKLIICITNCIAKRGDMCMSFSGLWVID